MDFELLTEFPYEIKEEWNQLLAESSTHVPFLRHEFMVDWWTTRGGGEWPDDSTLAIITAREEDRLIGIAPFFIAEHEGQNRLLLLGSLEICDYLDLICRPEDIDRFCEQLLPFIQQSLVEKEIVSGIEMYNVLEDSSNLAALEKAADAAHFPFSTKRLQHSPFITLPTDWETYLAGIDKKQRHEIRRKMRRASEEEIPATLYITSDPIRLEDDMEDFLELMAQDDEKDNFLSPRMREQMKASMRSAFENGYLQLAFLMVGEHMAAGYLNFDYLNRIWVYNSGLDKRYLHYSPGWVLLGHILQWAISQGREEFDFMRGDEVYKYNFGSKDRFIIRATIELKPEE